MNFNHVITSGCSFTYGAELLDKNDRYAKRISNSYNAALLDYSKGGYGNESISNRLIDGLLYQVKNNLVEPKKSLVIVCWTYGTRFAFYNKEVKGWFSLFPYRVDKNKLKHRLSMDVESDISFRKITENLHQTKNKNLISLMDEIRKLIHEHYVESDRHKDEVPTLLQKKIDNLNINLDKLSEYSDDQISNLKNKIDQYLSYAVFDSSFAIDKFFSKYVHFSDVKYYFDNHSDPLYLIYDLTSVLHRTKTFLECHGFNNYLFAFVCQNTKQLFQLSIDDYDSLFSDCYTREGFGEFKNMLTDIDTSRIFNEPFEQFALNNKYEIGNGGHPLEEAHQHYANRMIEFVNKRYNY